MVGGFIEIWGVIDDVEGVSWVVGTSSKGEIYNEEEWEGWFEIWW